jgi:acetylornithine deacetylase/succinyl-diaminopimelate desuccinylase-like protein
MKKLPHHCLRSLAALSAMAACLALPAGASAMTPAEATAAVQSLLGSAQYKAMAAYLDQDHDRIVEQNIALQQVPAPTFEEGAKAKLFAQFMQEAGLSTTIDEAGNVLALWKGRDSKAGKADVHVVGAHLDTVFGRDVDLSIQREGTRLIAPGILDDSRGLAALLAIVRAMKHAGVQTHDDLLFVATVGEEGMGDLRGVKQLFLHSEYKDRIRSAVMVDTGSPDQVVAQAAGSKRYEVHYKGPGGHSYRAFGIVSPMYALGAAMGEIGRLKTPKGTTYSIGLIGGGTSINSIPDDAWMQVDMRSASQPDLAALEAEFLKLIAAPVAAENQARSTQSGSISMQYKLVGDRPAGSTAADQRIVQIALAASGSQGWPARVASASTDANLPMSLNIPAVTVASGVGSLNHSTKEYLDIEKGQSVRALQVTLISILDAGRMVTGGR